MPEGLYDLVAGRWRGVFQNTLDGIVLIDEAGCLVEANPAACRLLGYGREELLQLSIFAITLPESQAQTEALWRQFIAEGKAHSEFVVRCKDGTVRDVEYKSVAHALPGLHLSVFHDISERKQSEKELIRYARRLEAMGDIDCAILAARSSREIAQAVVSHVHRLVLCRMACIFIFDYNASTVSAFPTRTPTERFLSPGTHHPIELLGDLEDLRQGRTRVVDDLLTGRDPSPLVDILLQEGIHAYAAFPILSENQLVAVLLLGVEQPSEVAPDRLTLAGQIAQRLAVALQGARLFEEVLQGRRRLEQLSRQLLKTQEAERLHIARELHDVIGQALAVTKVNLEVLKHAFPRQPLNDLVKETVSMIEEALEQARNLSHDLRPSLLDDMGLACAVEAYLNRQSQRSGFTAHCTVDPHVGRLPSDIETACFRILMEATTNIVRHANASRICAELRTVNSNLEMSIRDDGVGFDLAAAQKRATRGECMGLLGMQERAALLGGTVKITSAARQGTTIRVSIPTGNGNPAEGTH